MLQKPLLSSAINIILALLLALSLSSVIETIPAMAQSNEDKIFLGEALEDIAPYLDGEERKALTDSDLESIKQRIRALEKKLVDSRKELVESEEKLIINYEKLGKIRERKYNLVSQLQSINDEIIFTQRQINMVENYMDARRQEITQIDQEIISGNKQLEKQKGALNTIVRELHNQNRYPPLLALIGSANLSDHINHRSYLARVEQIGEQSYQGIKKMRNELIGQRISINKLKSSLTDLAKHLEDRRVGLTSQEEAKLRFLAETQEEEELYRRLLEDSRQKQLETDEEISNLRLDLRSLIDEGSNIITSDPEIFSFLQTPGGRGLIWPVTPYRGLSAYFLDPNYRRVFGIPHHAIDVRISQGTAVMAAASAYVLKAKDNGHGYSYIVLAHGGDMTTVYGHMSEITVKDGQTVRQGEIIGLSGGMPGSRGAGWLTTGPHLHFEVRIDGKPQNPIAYLPAVQLVEDLIKEGLYGKEANL